MRAVELTLRQGGRTWSLGTADAADRDRNYAISWIVQVPADAQPGPATLVSDRAEREVDLADQPRRSPKREDSRAAVSPRCRR